MRLSTVLIAVNHRLYILRAYSKQAIHTYDWNMNDDIVLSSTPFSIFCSVVSRFTFAARHVYSSLATPIVLLLLLHLHVSIRRDYQDLLRFSIWNVSPKKVPNNNKRKKKISSSSCSFVFLCDAFWLDTLFDFSISPRHVGA